MAFSRYGDSMKEIPLTQGKVVIVDDEDYDYLTQWKWGIDRYGYARRITTINGKQAQITMHRIINKTPKGMDTDHINHNRLDNRKVNLRTVTHKENQQNRIDKNYNRYKKIIDYQKRDSKYRARIRDRAKIKDISIGYHKTYEQAELAIIKYINNNKINWCEEIKY